MSKQAENAGTLQPSHSSIGTSKRHSDSSRDDDRIKEFEQFYLKNLKLLNEAVPAITNILAGVMDELKEELAIHDISGRVKTFENCIKKYDQKYRSEAASSGRKIEE